MKEHRVSWSVACLVVLAAALPIRGQVSSAPVSQQPGTQVEQTPESKIRANVLLVNSPVTVLNEKGELVSNLEAKDFKITDNSVPQKIAYFDLGHTPLVLVILIETSSRIEPLLPDMRKTAVVFANTVMGPDDEAAVMGFHASVDNLAGFTSSHDAIQDSISNLELGRDDAKLFDAMAMGVELLSSRLQRRPMADPRDSRPVIVILSEAIDVGSEVRLGAVLRRAQLSNVMIYSVGLPTTLAQLEAPAKDVRHHITPGGIFPQPGMPGTVQIPPTEDIRYGYGNLMNLNMWALKNVKDQITGHPLGIAASGTGGRHIATFGGQSMQRAVDEIGAELHSQYSLTYEPKGTNHAGYHRIKVSVDRKDLKVRARPGYYIAPPER
jgi:VWFA-related protein